MKKNKDKPSYQEIIARLKWFHGKDFEKYPLVEDMEEKNCIKPDGE